ncbi:hypothetical protein C8Q74DRAFT_1369711 [Fomes fomentarius]|nr:hypothetical protein C8Q74DRAFT_1369711 [Fomes fomentarius]
MPADILTKSLPKPKVLEMKLEEGGKLAEQTSQIKALLTDVSEISLQIDNIAASNGKSGGAMLDKTSAEVARLQKEVDELEEKVTKTKGNLDYKDLDKTKTVFERLIGDRLKLTAEQVETSEPSINPNGPTLAQIQAELTAANMKLRIAKDAKAKAAAAVAARTSANIPATQTALTKLKANLKVFTSEQSKLARAWGDMAKEVSDYLDLMEKDHVKSMPETQRALYNHIHKVSSTQNHLTDFATSLQDSAYNL